MTINTKIYGTIGPASYNTETLTTLIKNGMNGVRINLSHGNLPIYKKWISNIRDAEEISNINIPIIADIQGPEIRTGILENKTILLQKDKHITITSGNKTGNTDLIYINWPENESQLKLEQIININQTILIDDGLINLQVKSIDEKEIYCQIIQGGRLGERKGVNLPDVKLPLSSLTSKDKDDIELGIKLGINFIMLPFTRSINDIKTLRNYLDSKNGKQIGIFAKIENKEGINNLESFIENIDGVVIARGDLGVEIGITKVPTIQKDILKLCNQKRKHSIVVTHMLQSMIESPLPTRAEISDIANAVLDGCSGVMLTGETAIGKYPEKAIEYMYDTIYQTEKWKQR